jgi:hypothetical protein
LTGQVDRREYDQEQRDDQAQRFDRPQLGQLAADDPARLRGQDRGRQRDTDPRRKTAPVPACRAGTKPAGAR